MFEENMFRQEERKRQRKGE
jgi:hypothetical protein